MCSDQARIRRQRRGGGDVRRLLDPGRRTRGSWGAGGDPTERRARLGDDALTRPRRRWPARPAARRGRSGGSRGAGPRRRGPAARAPRACPPTCWGGGRHAPPGRATRRPPVPAASFAVVSPARAQGLAPQRRRRPGRRAPWPGWPPVEPAPRWPPLWRRCAQVGAQPAPRPRRRGSPPTPTPGGCSPGPVAGGLGPRCPVGRRWVPAAGLAVAGAARTSRRGRPYRGVDARGLGPGHRRPTPPAERVRRSRASPPAAPPVAGATATSNSARRRRLRVTTDLLRRRLRRLRRRRRATSCPSAGLPRALIVLAVLVVLAMAAGWFGWSWAQEKIDLPGSAGRGGARRGPRGHQHGRRRRGPGRRRRHLRRLRVELVPSCATGHHPGGQLPHAARLVVHRGHRRAWTPSRCRPRSRLVTVPRA